MAAPASPSVRQLIVGASRHNPDYSEAKAKTIADIEIGLESSDVLVQRRK